MSEYFVLAVCVSFPLYVYGLRGILLILFAGFISVGFACTDEFHQSFVAGRGPSKRDVMIDSIGAFAGILLVQFVCWIPCAEAERKIVNADSGTHRRRGGFPPLPAHF